MPRYDFKRIEPKWQHYWDENQTFQTLEEIDSSDVAGKEKLYVLDMFPYPSGNGLHVGHPEGYTATDIVCRYSRMRGKNVLHPMGWDAFGLPAEQHAVNTGTHPRVTTYKNIDTFRRQLKMLGFSYDWNREISTTDPDYFRWTQWIFLQVFDTWYDADREWTGPDGKTRRGKGRPISELPIPDDVLSAGEEAVRRYQDKHRLGYQHEAPVNWCSELRTVLSNEEVNAEGLSERGNHPVVRIPLRQWMLGITSYADRLLNDLDDLDWPESVKALQRNWIGRSEGAEVDFYIGNSFEDWKTARESSGVPREPDNNVIRVYTTRPDTLFGATYMVLAPEHPFVDQLTTPDQKAAVEEYRRLASLKSDLDRTDLAKEKTGVFTGSHAVNPVNGEQIPIWIADYVLISYGTGAIMAVPAHDDRDFEFATEFGLQIRCVIDPGTLPLLEFKTPSTPKTSSSKKQNRQEILEGKVCYKSAVGEMVNSDRYTGLTCSEFHKQICEDIQQKGLGKKAVNYRLRDWLFSRQHFWGEPFPIWHELDADGNPTGLMRTDPDSDLPIELPENFEFKPHGRPDPPLEEADEEWLYKTDTDGVRLKRETNSMPQWAGSCWYYLRFADPKNSERFIDPEIEKHWLPVDLYIGGAEHAVLHLLYSRFWHKVLFDRGHLTKPEPFQKLVNQGMILGEQEHWAYRDDKAAQWVSTKEVETKLTEGGVEKTFSKITGNEVYTVNLKNTDSVKKQGENFVMTSNPGVVVISRAYKMSKSRGNVINPDDVVDLYGADALRMYEMFMGPLEQMKPWNMSGVEGVSRFLGRVWRMVIDDRADDVVLSPAVQDVEPNENQLRVLHKTIKAVTEDIEKLSFNTAISRMMEFTNEISGQDPRPKAILEPFILLLSPFAPHIAEELWEVLGHSETLAYEPWPAFDESLLVESEIEIPVQIKGKLRSKIKVPADADQQTIQQAAEADETIAKLLDGKTVIKVIVVPGRLINFVVKG